MSHHCHAHHRSPPAPAPRPACPPAPACPRPAPLLPTANLTAHPARPLHLRGGALTAPAGPRCVGLRRPDTPAITGFPRGPGPGLGLAGRRGPWALSQPQGAEGSPSFRPLSGSAGPPKSALGERRTLPPSFLWERRDSTRPCRERRPAGALPPAVLAWDCGTPGPAPGERRAPTPCPLERAGPFPVIPKDLSSSAPGSGGPSDQILGAGVPPDWVTLGVADDRIRS